MVAEDCGDSGGFQRKSRQTRLVRQAVAVFAVAACALGTVLILCWPWRARSDDQVLDQIKRDIVAISFIQGDVVWTLEDPLRAKSAVAQWKMASSRPMIQNPSPIVDIVLFVRQETGETEALHWRATKDSRVLIAPWEGRAHWIDIGIPLAEMPKEGWQRQELPAPSSAPPTTEDID